MKTIRIIDLLNKIANREKVPEKIKYDTKEMKYNHNKQDYLGYYSNGNGEWLFQYLFDKCRNTEHFINDEVEVIEEEKEIEKLDVALLSQCDNWLRCPTNNVTKQDVELNPYIIDNIRENTLYFQRKINELIDAVNEMRKEK